jgi:hypothetical protein
MATIEFHNHSVFPYVEKHIDFLYASRKGLERKQRDEKVGINYSIILFSALLIEGQLESDLKNLVKHRKKIFNEIIIDDFYKRRIKNTVLQKMLYLIEDNISRNTGIDNYEGIFKLLSYKRTPAKYSDFRNLEGVKVLFHIRNVLAHGREISAKRIKARWTDNNWQNEFKGGYKITETYLIKKKLIKKGVIENRSAEQLFTNRVADHFYSISKGFLKFHSTITKQEIKYFTIYNIKGI